MPRKRKAVGARRRKMLKGDGFFGSLWDGIKSAVKKPSTWLAGASMIPSPLAMPLKAASVISGLTGNGKRKRRVQRGGAKGRLIGSALAN